LKVHTAAEQIKTQLGKIVFGEDKDNLESVILELYRTHNKSIGTTESCTGGNIARILTSIPGSSDVFQGSVAQHGAVSEETVIAMVKGGLTRLGVDVVVAVSGIAGPSGGTAEKPVGTIWIACGGANEIRTKRLNLTKNRAKNIEYTSNIALNMLRQYLM